MPFKKIAKKLEWRVAAVRNGFRDATAYRWEFLFEVLGSALVPAAIQWVLWYALFEIGGATEVAGMSYREMVHYTLMSVLFSQVRGGDHDFELAEMIRNGNLSNYLLRPVSVIEFVYIRGVAPKLFIAAGTLVMGVILGFFLHLSAFAMFVGMLMAFIGNIIHYLLGAALASTSFYWEESYSILMVKNMVVSLLSGELIPLSFFPQNLEWIWRATPFYLYVFGPTEVALGRWDASRIVMEFGISFGWLLLSYILVRITWGIGIRRYASLGG